MYSVDHIVVGGGIVGLAIASVLSRFGSTVLLERQSHLISETSSRNSGVVHSGIYYPPNTLKTRFCLGGNANTWRLMEKLPHLVQAQRCGKWIGTCSEDETSALESLMQRMKERNVPFELLSAQQQREREPNVRMRTVLNSTNTGIIDVESLKNAFLSMMENSGTDSLAVTGYEATNVTLNDGKDRVLVDVVETHGKQDATTTTTTTYAVRHVVCAAGLQTPSLWNRIHVAGDVDSAGKPRKAFTNPPSHHRLFYCRGRYAGYHGKPLVSRLVYPCPLPQLVGLGVHSTISMDGAVRFGPDAEYLASSGSESSSWYGCGTGADAETKFLDSQYVAIQRYLPSIQRDRLYFDFSGIRPKLSGEGMPFRDFLIEEVVMNTKEKTEKVANHDDDSPRCTSGDLDRCSMAPLAENRKGSSGGRCIILNGIESPGLTSSTAIADYIGEQLYGEDAMKQKPSLWAP